MLVVLSILVAGCQTPPTPAVLRVVVDQADQVLVVGASVTLSATVDVVGGASTAVRWSVDDDAVVSVSSSGVVTGVAEGETVVTATSAFDASKSDSVVVAVSETVSDGALDVPTGVTARPADEGVVLSWRFPAAPPGLTFDVERSVDGAPFELLVAVPAVVREHVDSTLVDGVVHAYRVRARLGDRVSAFSGLVSYRAAVIEADIGEFDFLGSLDDGLGVAVPGATIRSGAVASLTVADEPSEALRWEVIGSVVRVSLPRADIDLDADEPLSVWIPPREAFSFDPDDALMALIRVRALSGEMIEFVGVYTLNLAPVYIDIGMLRSVAAVYGLPEVIEIEVSPLVTPRPGSGGVSASASEASIYQLTNLHRIERPASSDAMQVACEPVDGFSAVRTAFNATAVGHESQAAWTRAVGKRPLVLVHGYQGYGYARAELDGTDAWLAPLFCGWREFVEAFFDDPSLVDAFTLYTFGYDSVWDRIAVNASKFGRQLEASFGDDPVFVVAHSMGGIVTHAAIQGGANVAQLYSLGTPYRGSAGAECIDADGVRCNLATNTITYDWVLSFAADAAMRMIQYPGGKDLTFEVPFKTHSELCLRLSCKRANVPNPYLEALNGWGLSRPDAYTAFVGNTVREALEDDKQIVDNHFGAYEEHSVFTSLLMRSFLGRFNDNIVSVGSAAFLDLADELLLSYADLGALEDRSPFGTVVLAPCIDHDMLQQEFELLLPPTGSWCSTASPYPDGGTTIYGWIAADLKGRFQDLEESLTFTTIAAGNAHALALDADGNAWAWGAGGNGRLGYGGTSSQAAPVAVTMPTGVAFTSVAAGFEHSLALDADGNAWAWGYGDFGQLGTGDELNRLVPTPVSMPAGVAFTSVAAGGFHSLALDTTGAAWAWGYGELGQLGNDGSGLQLTPVRVSMPAGVSFMSVSGGLDHSLALDASGAAWAWGFGFYGQLGVGDDDDRFVPNRVSMPGGVTFTSVSAGLDHSLALDASGAAWAWGFGSDGQLGNGAGDHRNVPVSVSMPAATVFTSLAAGNTHSLAIDGAGTGWAWGSGDAGQLGYGSRGGRFAPVPVSMPSGRTFRTLAAGGAFSLALDGRADAWAWGRGADGRLGTGSVADQLLPDAVTMP